MALDLKKRLQQAERLLKQGKVPAAILELERLADQAPNDVLTLNRIGDLLAKQGRRDEAIRFFSKIADQFSQSGFLPKAVAIHKKILRLNAHHIASLVELGQLYFQQKLPGEARTYLLRAADQYLQASNFAKAREVYETLVEAEPEDPRHRARLAEARAAEGETARAGEELIELAGTLFNGGQPADAEKAYRRAAELLPDRDEPLIGLVRSLGEQGKNDEALALLDQAEQEQRSTGALLGERILRLEQGGRGHDAAELLKLPTATEIDDQVFAQVFRYHRERGDVKGLWDRYDPILERWRDVGQVDRVVGLLGSIAEIEEAGHVPAIERLLDVHRSRNDHDQIRVTLEQLVQVCRTQSRTDEAERFLAELRERAPDSPLISGKSEPPLASVDPSADRPVAAESSAPVDLPPVVRPEGDPPIEAEAPAVPLSRGDEEYVSGRMTQAEILEKYGLRQQALEQVCEVTAKFPGHVPAQEKMVELQREGGVAEELRDAWIALALARRASGDATGAREACAEAASSAPLECSTTTMLAQLGLIDTIADVAPPAEVPAPTPVPVAEAEPRPEFASRTGGDGELFIDFDAMDDDEPEIVAAEATPQEGETDRTVEAVPEVPEVLEVPVADSTVQAASPPDPAAAVVAEIEELLDRGDVAEAERRLTALETLGWARDQVGGLRVRVDAGKAPAATDARPIDSVGVGSELVDDDDLSAITAALESELFADDTTLLEAEPESEQSLEDVFAAFKEQVDQEVDHDDYRTHYDLGIGYKEMGLLDEAIAEFENSVRSPDLGRESFAMLALCHRERDDLEAAARCYREAIATSNSDGETLKHLRYDLADVLAISGDREGALDQLRDVMGADPSFRDVRERIAELESCPS